MDKTVYLDNSATTKPCKKAIEYMTVAMEKFWGNPSSLHTLGMEAEIEINNARRVIAKIIKAREDEIIFTGSGTEANNTAVFSAIKKHGKKIITSVIEHPSILESVKRLEDDGYEIVRLKVDEKGIVLLDELEKALDSNTCLVSIMLVNNEVGSIQPIEDICKLVKKISPNTLVHCDAVQAFGKIPINVGKLGVDLLSVSAHKVHGPKGIGFLYCRKNVKIAPFIMGGGQERGMRSGTEPVPAIMGFMGACEELEEPEHSLNKLQELWNYAKQRFEETDLIKINSPDDAIPYILNISVLGYRSETLLHFLEQKNIFVSSGSACAKGEASYVLSSMGIDKSQADSALRLSFSKDNSKEDIDLCIEALKSAVTKLRRSDI